MDATTHPVASAPRTRTRHLGARLSIRLRSIAYPSALFVVLRVWTMLWAGLVAAYIPPAAAGAHFYYGMEPLRDAVFAPWQRWDTLWYTKIALEGYAEDERAVFAPLYPYLIRVVEPFTGGNGIAAGLLIASAAALAGFILLYQLAKDLFDEAAARRALLFFAFFPTAFFLFAAYSESLFLALALGAFWCARKRNWLGASILGGLAAMTRPQGMLFLAPLAVEFWMQYRERQVTLGQGWTLGLVALGGLAHVSWLTYQFGSPEVWLQAQSVWHRAALPWDVLADGWNAVAHAPFLYDAALRAIDPFFAIVFLLGLVWSAQRLPASLTVYMATIVLPPLFVVTTYSESYPLTAVARYVLVAFPMFLLLGALPKRFWQAPVWAVSFLAQTIGLVLFCAWVFVR